jgi:lantibiotic modifying enzyme
MGTALCRAFEVTGIEYHLDTARGAIAYDESLCDATHKNCGDTRVNDSSFASRSTDAFPVAWCHGAAGILLSRLQASAIDSDRRAAYASSITNALSTTCAYLDDTTRLPRVDCTLCHGIAGLIETILVWAECTGERRAADLCGKGVRYLLECIDIGSAIPSGLPGGHAHPSLFLGDSGVAWVLLRILRDRYMPSVLLI